MKCGDFHCGMTQFWGCVEQRQQQLQNKSNCKSKSKNEMRGFLHCATHDETVSGFGRNDAVFGGSKKQIPPPSTPLRVRSDKCGLRNDKQRQNKTTAKTRAKMRGVLHCATHDETVSGFGRNDAVVLSDQRLRVRVTG